MDKISYMKPEHLSEWQDHMGFSSVEAAESLGIALNTYLNYRRGYRTMSSGVNSDVAIPKSVSVECASIVTGILAVEYKDIYIGDYPQ